jgi:hypothetical protein
MLWRKRSSSAPGLIGVAIGSIFMLFKSFGKKSAHEAEEQIHKEQSGEKRSG